MNRDRKMYTDTREIDRKTRKRNRSRLKQLKANRMRQQYVGIVNCFQKMIAK